MTMFASLWPESYCCFAFEFAFIIEISLRGGSDLSLNLPPNYRSKNLQSNSNSNIIDF